MPFQRSCAWVALACAIMFLAPGCIGYKEVSFRGVTGVQLARMDAKGLALTAQVVLDNPNGYRIHVADPDVDVYLNEQYLGKATIDSKVTLARKRTDTYNVPLHVDFTRLGSSPLMALMGAALTGKATLKVKGSVRGRVGLIGRKFPFEEEHVIDLGR